MSKLPRCRNAVNREVVSAHGESSRKKSTVQWSYGEILSGQRPAEIKILSG
jgi:hypothetical protein